MTDDIEGGVSFTLDSEKKHFISPKIVINLSRTYEKIPPQRKTISVQQIARSFLTDRQTQKHPVTLL